MPVSAGCFCQILYHKGRDFSLQNRAGWLAWHILGKIYNISNVYYLKLNVLENTDKSNICSPFFKKNKTALHPYLSGFWQNALFMLSFLGSGQSV